MRRGARERFLAQVEQGNGCWVWLASKNNSGYGKFFMDGKLRSAHRAAWTLFKNEPIGDMHVLHTCDNKACVNPEHLFLGTNYDNVQDMIRKGRGSRGERHSRVVRATWRRRFPGMVPKVKVKGTGPVRGEAHGRSKLTAAQAQEILDRAHDGESIRALADELRILYATAWEIARGKSWKHLKPVRHSAIIRQHLARGSAHSSSKLSEEQARDILRRARAGEQLASLAREFGVTPQSVWAIAHRKSWKYLDQEGDKQ